MSSTYFITGATGLIGGALVEHLINQKEKVVLLVRNRERAERALSHLPGVMIIEGNLENPIIYDGDIDYIIHAAAPTNSSFFIEQPVETIDAIVLGTKSVLEFAKEKQVISVVNLSSMEVYGTPTNEEMLTEDQQFYLDPLNVRSNYPTAKRLAENMCVAYAAEYDVPVKIARLAQVLGSKLLPDDDRVIAQFIRAAKKGFDIKIATDGETKQTYVGIDDSVAAILTILGKGDNGEAYNIANPETYSSIRSLAELIAKSVGGDNNNTRVMVNTRRDNSKYPPNRTLRLNADKLKGLGWEPKTSLVSALEKLANS